MAFRRICAREELPSAEGVASVRMDGVCVLLARLADGTVQAFQAECPHQGVDLGQGWRRGNHLTCHAHLWTFDLRTGGPLGAAACGLARYPVRLEGGDVLVETDGVEARCALR